MNDRRLSVGTVADQHDRQSIPTRPALLRALTAKFEILLGAIRLTTTVNRFPTITPHAARSVALRQTGVKSSIYATERPPPTA